jgi:hypothetical protein
LSSIPQKDFKQKLTKEIIQNINSGPDEIYDIKEKPVETNKLLKQENMKKYDKTQVEKTNFTYSLFDLKLKFLKICLKYNYYDEKWWVKNFLVNNIEYFIFKT